MNNQTNFTFQTADARDPLLETRRKFGPGDPGHITYGSVQAWLGNRAVVYDIRKLLLAKKVTLPEHFDLMANYDIWVVYYAFGIAQESNFKEVVRARLEAQYEAEPHVTIYQVFPTTEFTTWGSMGGTYQTNFQLSGEVGKTAKAAEREVAQLPGILPSASAALNVGGDVAISMKLKVATLNITAAGINNDYGIWEFRKHDEFLAGDHQVGHILLVRRPVNGPVMAKLRLSVDVGTVTLWTSSRYSKWVPVALEPPSQ